MSQASRVAPPTAVPAPSGQSADGSQLTLEVLDAGQLVGLLTNNQGFAVYGNSRERIDNIVCVASCTDAWRPVTPAEEGLVISDRLDPNNVRVFERPDGTDQVAYRNTPLYVWTGDTEVGVPNGAGVAGTWFALTAGGTQITS